jgi:hypothetical protein
MHCMWHVLLLYSVLVVLLYNVYVCPCTGAGWVVVMVIETGPATGQVVASMGGNLLQMAAAPLNGANYSTWTRHDPQSHAGNPLGGGTW